MIIVSGLQRSGTSLWMRVLQQWGFPMIGTPFPRDWGRTIREMNPLGFFESEFRSGVYHATNPHPRTGRFLHPDEVRDHAVKVFIPGLVRSDLAYVRRVLVCVRGVDEQTRSAAALEALEAARRATPVTTSAFSERIQKRAPHDVIWLAEVYRVVRDANLRRYDVAFIQHDELMHRPGAVLRRVSELLEREVTAEVRAVLDVRPVRSSTFGVDVHPMLALAAPERALADELYTSFGEGRRPSERLIQAAEEILRRHGATAKGDGKRA